MITDKDTNKLYLADTLKSEFPSFYDRFIKILVSEGVNPEIIRKTKDVWAVDFMPVQVSKYKFVRFKYEPDYLTEYKEFRTDSKKVKIDKEISVINSEINLDGGNVIRQTNSVIICDKIFQENGCFSTQKMDELDKKLIEMFEVEKIVYIPWDKDDFTGHADGMVRFINEKKVLISEFTKDVSIEAQIGLRTSLKNAGFEIEEIPVYIPDDPTGISARGNYLNFLQLSDKIFMPYYNLKSDEEAYQKLSELFECKIIPVPSSDLAKEGGVLNCISWNILE